ncbi:Non-functional NADPH-dependent codeinone reductase 2 [Capsicum baccatum]|uniref:Non-functional NADPH-dependent codeinone reductase 2 n=1 Tax=Capsicum baccatum TaxID=33114 RepID=A0A2G2X821_CAPBA|nr:Non-functional NADPH-dependent codeinone reductase 2 [Capsicum baccatum]
MEEVVHVPEVVLNSGYKMPVLGMGTATYPMPRLDELPSILVDAIEAGYRHFDTAALYGSEEALGRAVAEAIERGIIKNRQQVFITSLIPFLFLKRPLTSDSEKEEEEERRLHKCKGKESKAEGEVKQYSTYISSTRTSATGPSTNKRKRGVTQMQAVHGRIDRQLIVLNRLNQPIGRTKAVVTEFSSFLGTLARNGEFCPLNLSWTKLKTHDDMWSYIQVEMERVETQESEDGTQSTDSFTTVTGSDHPDRVRLLGRGVTKTLLKQKIQSSGLDFVPLRNVHIVYVPDEEASTNNEFRVFYADRTPWHMVIKAVEMPGHGSKLYDNTAIENLTKSIEVITKFRESKFDIVKAGLAANSEVYGNGFATVTIDLISGSVCCKLGLAKSIGVSNFSCTKLSQLLQIATIPPAVNQVEMNVAWQQQKLLEFCKEKGVHVSAYSPLGSNGASWNSPIINDISTSKQKTTPQVALRWIYEQGESVIVKSFNKERMKQNLEIFDWELSNEDKIRREARISTKGVQYSKKNLVEEGSTPTINT